MIKIKISRSSNPFSLRYKLVCVEYPKLFEVPQHPYFNSSRSACVCDF